jgi:hypothetical protein
VACNRILADLGGQVMVTLAYVPAFQFSASQEGVVIPPVCFRGPPAVLCSDSGKDVLNAVMVESVSAATARA